MTWISTQTMAHGCRKTVIAFTLSLLISSGYAQPKSKLPVFKKHVITSEFIAEGVSIADVNRDGHLDILAGAYWFEAPAFKRHALDTPKIFHPATGYSNSFLDFTLDVNLDGWPDLIRISLPGEEAVWYENNKGKPGYWPMRLITHNAGNESPALTDLDGDGRADLVCNDPVAKEIVWYKAPVRKGDTSWQRFVISAGELGTDRYTHGLGLIDMNGDGRLDVVITKGWWEAPPDRRQRAWVFHAEDLGEECSQIYALGKQGGAARSLVSASAHQYGIWWHEKKTDTQGKSVWQHHTISKLFSQTHALAMGDINGDGQPDLVTGKRYFAHLEKDPGALDSAVLYWFEYKPGPEPLWIPHLIDDQSGVGLQALIRDLNGDGLPDIIICNKKGLFFFEQMGLPAKAAPATAGSSAKSVKLVK